MDARKKAESVLISRLPSDLIKIVLLFVPVCYRLLQSCKIREHANLLLATAPEGNKLITNGLHGVGLYSLEATTGLRREKCSASSSEAWRTLNAVRIVDIAWKEDEIFMVDRKNDKILVFNPDGCLVREWYIQYPFAIAVCQDRVFVASGLKKIGRLTYVFSRSTGQLLHTWPKHYGMFWKMDAMRDEIYVSDCEYERVIVFSFDGQMKRTWGEEGENPGQFRQIRGILVYKNEVYVCDNNRVQVFTPQGHFLRQWFLGNRNSYGALITSCSDGSIIVADNHTLYRYCIDFA